MSAWRHVPVLLGFSVALAVTACASTVAPSSPSPGSAAAPSRTPTPSVATSTAPVGSTLSSAAPSAPAALAGQIVFEDAGQDFKFSQIWIENADGTNVRKVVTDQFTDAAGSLSPDGRKILFYRFDPAKDDAPGTMFIVNTDGSDLHEVATGDRAKGCDDGPEGDAWSPDGKRIAYARFCFDSAGQFVQGGIWTAKPDGTDAREITRNRAGSNTEDHRAGWSPDGKLLAFQRLDTSVNPERGAIFTIGIDGKRLHQVTAWSVDGNDPDWSPDGTSIVFNASAEPSATQNIYTIHPDGTGLAQLTTYDENGQATYHPTWSPDGSQILFAHSPATGGWADFFVMNRDGSSQHPVASTELHENHGQWGPDPAP
jgi:TolB protein